MRDVVGLLPVPALEPLVHQRLEGRSLIASALSELGQVADEVVVWATDPGDLGELLPTGVRLLGPDRATELVDRCTAARVVVIHDPLCPLVPAAFIRRLTLLCLAGHAHVGVRPVVDTIKATEDDVVSGTVDRDGLRLVTAPLAIPGRVAPDVLPGLLADADLAAAVHRLRAADNPLDLVVAPSAARRVTDVSDLRLMASVGAVSHRVREHD